MGVFGFGNKKKQQREERIEEMRIQIEKDSMQIKERLLALKVGDELNFGQYYYDDYVYKDISWKVLDINYEGEILVITNYGIEVMPQRSTLGKGGWFYSDIRIWLNDNFFYSSFNNAEKSFIVEKNIECKKNSIYYTKGGVSIASKLFLLDVDEVLQYFCNGYIPEMYDDIEKMKMNGKFSEARELENASRRLTGTSKLYCYDLSEKKSTICFPIPYALEKKCFHDDKNAGIWWLRTPGAHKLFSVCVLPNGDIRMYGMINDGKGVLVRPAMWLHR